MEEDVKLYIEQLNNRFEVIEKRFDDIKWYIGGAIGFFTIIFAVVSILAGLRFSDEIKGLADFKKDIKADLGLVESRPEIEILGPDGNALVNKEIRAEITLKEDKTIILTIHHIIRNVGNAMSGVMFAKLYVSDPIQLWDKSSDEPKFQYETSIMPKHLDPNEIPGGRYSSQWNFWISLKNKVTPPPGNYPALLKIYYGKGKVSQANFTLVVGKD